MFRVALAILKTNEAALLKQDNIGLLLRELRQAVQHLHDRDKLMKVSVVLQTRKKGMAQCRLASTIMRHTGRLVCLAWPVKLGSICMTMTG